MYSEFEINFKVVFMKTKKLFQCVMAAILICGSINVYDVSACTNIIVGRKASTDGSVFLRRDAQNLRLGLLHISW